MESMPKCEEVRHQDPTEEHLLTCVIIYTSHLSLARHVAEVVFNNGVHERILFLFKVILKIKNNEKALRTVENFSV
jgi:hypothetical protein